MRVRVAALALAIVGLLTACGLAVSVVGHGPALQALSLPTIPAPVVVRTAVPAAPVAPTPTAQPVVAVRPLTTLVSPDLLVTGTTTVTAAQQAAIGRIVGVQGVVPVDAGALTIGGRRVLGLGVDPGTFRAVTPAPTASSDPLWQSVARGELSVAYGVRGSAALGHDIALAGHPVRVGSYVDLRMPTVGAVVDQTVGRRAGLTPAAGLVVSAPSRDVVGLERDVLAVLHPAAENFSVLRIDLPVAGHATMSEGLYKAAARTCPGLPWSILAAIGGIESDHGADVGVSSAGAEGPMQFLPTTFAQVAVDGDGDGKALIDDPADAVFTAARLLCQDGAGRGGQALYGAIFSYNHADWYVAAVESLAARYAAAG